MTRKSTLMIGIAAVWLAVVGGQAMSTQDKYTLKVPGGLAFAESKEACCSRTSWRPRWTFLGPSSCAISCR